MLSSPEIKLWCRQFAGLATEWQITVKPIASRPSSSSNQIYEIEPKDICVEEVVSGKLYLQIRPRSAEHCARRACGVVRGWNIMARLGVVPCTMLVHQSEIPTLIPSASCQQKPVKESLLPCCMFLLPLRRPRNHLSNQLRFQLSVQQTRRIHPSYLRP